jgi:hypothetical protein
VSHGGLALPDREHLGGEALVRLGVGEHAFYAALLSRQPLATALAAAQIRDPAFAAGHALYQLFQAGLVRRAGPAPTSIHSEGDHA